MIAMACVDTETIIICLLIRALRGVIDSVVPIYWQEEIHLRHFEGWMHQSTVDKVILIVRIICITCASLAFGLSMFLLGKHFYWIF